MCQLDLLIAIQDILFTLQATVEQRRERNILQLATRKIRKPRVLVLRTQYMEQGIDIMKIAREKIYAQNEVKKYDLLETRLS